MFFLSYTLTPHGRYPTQMAQAVECLRYILGSRNPRDIYLGGDSAGGNLVLAVMSHMAYPHPHPKIEPLPATEPLAGAILISPWTWLQTQFLGRVIDARGDIVGAPSASRWVPAYVDEADKDNYTDISPASHEWYREAGRKVNKVLVLAGEHEVLLPIIQDFVDKLKVKRRSEVLGRLKKTWLTMLSSLQTVHPSVEYFEGHQECHVSMIYNRLVLSKTATEKGKRVISWLAERINEPGPLE